MNAPIRIKSFRGRNLSDALRKVRSELGPDAIILETKPTSRAGFPWSTFSWSRSRVEVTASAGPAPKGQSAQPSAPILTQTVASTMTHGEPIPIDQTELVPEESCDDSAPVPYRTSTKYKTCYPDPYIQVAYHLLLRDLPAERIEFWLRQALDELGPEIRDAWTIRAHIAQTLRSEIPIDPPSQDWHGCKSAIAVIGPPGHGKSSAVAQLASLASMHYGLQPLIITCAHPSTPIHPRLAEYCSLMGWGYEQVDAPKLSSVVATARDRWDWIVLDLPSIPLGDLEGMEVWRSHLIELSLSQIHLTLSATTAIPHLQRLFDWYQGLAPSHLLPTRVDEAQGLGSIYPFLSSARTPLGFAAFGSKIPSDIRECDPAHLAQWILGSDTTEPVSFH